MVNSPAMAMNEPAASQPSRLIRLLERLDSRARAESAPAAATIGGQRATLAACLLVFLVMFAQAGKTGLNEEMVAGIYLYPYVFPFDQPAVDPPSPQAGCVDGYFVQTTRPVFGICCGETRLPLLFNAYTSAFAYWPLRLVGRAVPRYELIITRGIPGLLLLLLLLLMTRQVSRRSGPLLGAASVAAMLLFPMSVMYGSLYLYEYLPALLLFAIWWLLDRYNASGGWLPFSLAALLFGFALQQKFTAALVLPVFLPWYVALFGLRRVGLRLALLAALFAALFPSLFLLVYLKYTEISGRAVAIPDFSHPVPIWRMVPEVARWIHTALPIDPRSWDGIAALSFLFGLLLYSGRVAVRFFRTGAGDRTLVLASLTMLSVLAAFLFLYRYNPGSSPTLQFLPFTCIVLAGAFRDGLDWLAARIGRAGSRPAMVVGTSALVVASVFARWPAFLESFFHEYRYPRYREQEQLVGELLAREVTRPVMLNSFENGVYELLSRGAIRPRYLNSEQCLAIDDEGWDRVLRQIRGQNSRFLFSASPSPMDPAHRCNGQAVERFRQALVRNGYGEIRGERIGNDEGGRAYDLFIVAPDAAEAKTRVE